MIGTATICVRTDLKATLDRLKVHPKESYSDVIERLTATAFDDEPLSEKELAGIQEALEDVKAGRVYSLDAIKGDIGLKCHHHTA